MSWLMLALLAPLLWGASNLVDEHLVNTAVRDPITLVLNTGLFASLPAVFVAATGRWTSCDSSTACIALIGGIVGVLVYYPYFKALVTAPPTAVVLMWNLSPVLIAVMAHAVVHERLVGLEYLALAMLVASSALATGLSRSRPAGAAFRWMLVASVLLAISSVLEKATYERLAFWPGFGWLSLGSGVATATVAALSPMARSQLVGTYRTSLATVLIGNELLDLGAIGALNLATSIAPVSLVHAVGGTQPVFILLVSRLLPRRKRVSSDEWIRTVVAAALAIIGLGLLRST